MKLFKSLLLGSAAGLVAVSGASAADLGVKKPTPVEYVRICSAHGAGFFFIPGSDTCLQISGRVRAEYLYRSPSVRGEDTSGFRSHGRLNIDARTTTEYGLLRTFFRLDSYGNSGNYLPASATAASNGTGAASAVTRAGISTSGFGNTYLDKAFIQFYTGSAGFITAGRTQSFFDFNPSAFVYSDTMAASDNPNADTFAYTFTFGGGFSATLAVESSTYRRTSGAALAGTFAATTTAVGIATAANIGQFPAGTVVGAVGVQTLPANFYPVGGAPAAGDISGAAGQTLVYSRQSMPELIANLRVDQSWGSAQLSGVLREIMVANWWQPVTAIAVAGNGNVAVTTNAAANPRYVDTEYGWAIQAGVKINLPMLAAGSNLVLQAAYGQGAQSYVLGSVTGNSNSTGGIITNADGYVDALGNMKLATSWSVMAGLSHFFTPSVRGAVMASYSATEYNGLGANRSQTAATVAGSNLFLGSRSGFNDFTTLAVHGVLEWIPVRNFTIGASVHWLRLDPQGSVLTTVLNANGGQGGPAAAGVGTVRLTGSEDTFSARLRFERSF